MLEIQTIKVITGDGEWVHHTSMDVLMLVTGATERVHRICGEQRAYEELGTLYVWHSAIFLS